MLQLQVQNAVKIVNDTFAESFYFKDYEIAKLVNLPSW